MARQGVRFANLPDALLRYRLHSAAIKSRHVRASLRDTIRIKERYWRDRMGLRARLRLLGERCLLLLPQALVLLLFRRLAFDRVGAR